MWQHLLFPDGFRFAFFVLHFLRVNVANTPADVQRVSSGTRNPRNATPLRFCIHPPPPIHSLSSAMVQAIQRRSLLRCFKIWRGATASHQAGPKAPQLKAYGDWRGRSPRKIFPPHRTSHPMSRVVSNVKNVYL